MSVKSTIMFLYKNFDEEEDIMAQRHVVRLSQEEHKELEGLVYKGKVAAHKRLHAQILLKSDVGEWGESQAAILLTLHSRNRFFAPPFLPFIDRAFIDAWF